MTEPIFIHNIKLPEKENDDFSKKFNDVSELYRKANDETLTEEDQEGYMKAFISAKYCLEQGI